MLGVGDQLPQARVWTSPQESVGIGELAADGRILLVFYLFDWSST